MIPKPLVHLGTSPCVDSTVSPPPPLTGSPAQGQVTPELLQEETGIHDWRHRGKGGVGGGGAGEMTNVSCVRGNATTRSRFTPGDFWPCPRALRSSSCLSLTSFFSPTHPPHPHSACIHHPPGHPQGLFPEEIYGHPGPSTSAHKFLLLRRVLRERVLGSRPGPLGVGL